MHVNATALAWQRWFIGLWALPLVSDTLLAAHVLGGWRFPFIQDAIWLTYGPGQMLIVYSAIGAAAFEL